MQEIPRELIEQAAAGDTDAFAHIYRLASGFVYTLAYRVAGNRQEAEEITQDVFLKIHRYLGTFGFRSSFKTWVYRIAVNAALTAYQRTRRDRTHRVDLEKVEAVLPAPQAPDQREARELADRLLEKLNPDQRACLVLREIEGLSYEEMAQALGININTVRSRLKRARAAAIELGRRHHEMRESA
jgi:RNA polymerase sigma-70 factor (ECF subfamily)